jgi:hypothetical protein
MRFFWINGLTAVVVPSPGVSTADQRECAHEG